MSAPRGCRLPGRWQRWLLVWTLVAFLSVFSTAATHHHQDEAQALDCPVCHVVGHQPLDAHPPELYVAVDLVLWLVLSIRCDRPVPRAAPQRRAPPSRAPPLLPAR